MNRSPRRALPEYELDLFWAVWNGLDEAERQTLRDGHEDHRITIGEYLYRFRPDLWEQIASIPRRPDSGDDQ